MTRRIDKPDTPSDIELRALLDNRNSFIMVAGAGSGKTTSLVKALDHIEKKHGKELRLRGQKVACITYTEVAEKEIWADVGHNPLFHVSTIHSFLWSLAKPFQKNIKSWVKGRIEQKLIDLANEAAGFGKRVQQRTRDKNARDIRFYQEQLSLVDAVDRFTYEKGSDYSQGILGHDDIVKMVPTLIKEHLLLKKIVAQKYPFFFVDESQDTLEIVVSALIDVDTAMSKSFCLGFFGDPMQKIYATGVGPIPKMPTWSEIRKPENFRCSAKVLEVINKIRKEGDGLVQTGGRTETVGGRLKSVNGSAFIFVLPTDENRDLNMLKVRKWLATKNQDALWEKAQGGSELRILVIVHRMAAKRLGFAELYSAFNDSAPSSLKDGFNEGTAWPLLVFHKFLVPLVEAQEKGRSFDVISLLRQHCPKLAKDSLNSDSPIATILRELQQNVEELKKMLAPNSAFNVAGVLNYIRSEKLAKLDDRFLGHLDAFNNNASLESEDEDVQKNNEAIAAFLACEARQLRGYQQYFRDESPYSTQQGIKGAEFERVMVVLDDEEGTHNQFSFEKLLGLKELSDTDQKNISENKDSTPARTRRLFYVCCSRSLKDLAVVLFVNNVEFAISKMKNGGIFLQECVYSIADLEHL